MSERRQYDEIYAALTVPFLKSLQLDANIQFSTHKLPLPSNWEFIGDQDSPCKIKAVNQKVGIFVKAFSPYAAAYTDACLAALQELSTLPLNLPILAPVTMCRENGVSGLVFPLGIQEFRNKYGKVYQIEERNMIQTILEQYSLRPLSPLFDNVVVVTFNSQQYVIDPFDDTEASIWDFNEVADDGTNNK